MASPNELIREALQVIGRLRRNRGRLYRSIDEMGERCWQVLSPRNGWRRPVLTVAAEVGELLLRANLIVAENEAAGRFRLAPATADREAVQDALIAALTPAEARRLRRQRTVHEEGGRPRTVLATGAESPLEWLARRKDAKGRPYLDPAEVTAGERLRADYEAACLSPRVTMIWDATISVREKRRTCRFGHDPADVSERALAARRRVDAALAVVGPGLSDILVEVVCLASGLEAAERRLGWPRRSARLVLKFALMRLAAHYGMLKKEKHACLSRILHWGLPDHVPERALPETLEGAGDEPGS